MDKPNSTPSTGKLKGWVFYDEDCSFCTRVIDRCRTLFEGVGFNALPLQSVHAKDMLGYQNANDMDELLKEMKVATVDGQLYGGSEAVIFLARQFWWAFPAVAFSYLPGIRFLLDKGYKAIAERRHCSSGSCSIKKP